MSTKRISLAVELDKIAWWHVLIVALAIRLGVLWMHRFPSDLTEPLKVGITLATKGYLGNPFSIPTGITAHVAPAYSVLVAAVCLLTHGSRAMLTTLSVIMAIISSLNIAALVLLSRAMRLPSGAGSIAALMFIVPMFAWIELGAQHEDPLYVSVILIALWSVVRALKNESPALADGCILGAAVGAAAYVTPVVLPMTLMAGIATWGVAHLPRRRAMMVGGAALGVFLMAIAPYTIRNRVELGGWFFIRDDLGLELAMSNAQNAQVTERENARPGGTLSEHPTNSRAVAAYVREVGELSYNHELLRSATGWIRAHPGAFTSLTLRRIGYVLVPASVRWYQRLLGGLISGLFLIGSIVLWRSQERLVIRSMVGAAVGYAGIYAFVESQARYVYPLYWIESLVVGSFLALAVSRVGSLRSLIWRPLAACRPDARSQR